MEGADGEKEGERVTEGGTITLTTLVLQTNTFSYTGARWPSW